MSNREITPTHSAYLELKDERAGMHEGYRFLDEKRLILAAEILAVLADYERTLAEYRAAAATAGSALRAAIGRHGLDGLAVYPPAPAPDCAPAQATRSVLGVRIEHLAETTANPKHPTDAAPADRPAAASRSPEGEHCRDACVGLLAPAARLAMLTGNLERLRLEYIRTARRARALEDVLLPEIDETLRAVDTALEELEREEAVRVRRSAR